MPRGKNDWSKLREEGAFPVWDSRVLIWGTTVHHLFLILKQHLLLFVLVLTCVPQFVWISINFHSSGLRENQFSPKLNCSSDAIISPGQHCYFIHFVWRAYSRKDSTGTFISFSSDALHYVFSFSRLQLFRAGGRNLHLISSCWLICPRESSEVWIKATRQSVN